MKQPRTEKFDIARFKEYVESYEENYPDRQNIMFCDMLYGIAICVDSEKFNGHKGFNEFLKWLSEGDESEQFQESYKRYKEAIESLILPESQIFEPSDRLKHAIQIAAFGKVMDFKSENNIENDKV